MKARLLMSCLLLLMTFNVFSQETEWEPQRNVTGYISLQGEYINDLQYAIRDYGASVTEAGLLVNYMPLPGLTIKAVTIYRPLINIENMINELSAERQIFNKKNFGLKLKVGRILTPLSPINTNFYAPVNIGITLPLMVSHHELYPVNIDGLCLTGTHGQDMKLSYNIFGGGFRNSLLMSTGPLKFFGNEDSYLLKINNKGTGFNLNEMNSELSFGGGAHVGLAYKDMLEVGANYFTHVKGQVNISQVHPVYGLVHDTVKLRRHAYGANLKFSYKGLTINGEQWWCQVNTSNSKLGSKDTSAVSTGGYYEIMYNIKKFTPYVKFESHNVDLFDFLNLEYNRYTVGINYKPSFEVTLKLEYVHYDYEKSVDGGLISVIYSF